MKREKIISGQEALARAAGVTRTTIGQHWLRDANWRWGRGPWKQSDLPAILNFGRQRKRRSDDPAVAGRAMMAAGAGAAGDVAAGKKRFSKDLSQISPLEAATIAQKMEASLLSKAKRAVFEAKWVKKEDVERERVARIHAVKNAMLALPDSGIIESIRGADNEHEAKEILRGRILEMLAAFAGGKH